MDGSSTPKSPSIAPVHDAAQAQEEGPLEEGIALCLSGGGYRAMLFHLGALWRLNEIGYLPRLKRVSSVSGGSITAGLLGLVWPGLGFDEYGVARCFNARLVEPLRRLASTTIDIPAVLHNLVRPGAAGGHIANAYRQHLFGRHTLQDLPDDDGPLFVINGTNLGSGVLWRFSRPYMADYRVGRINNPNLELAIAVAVSSAAPPFLSPVFLDMDPASFVPGSGRDLQSPPYTQRAVLSDGGVYDNLGLETAWKRCRTVLVSDGGGHMGEDARPHGMWLLQTFRVLAVIDNQVRDLRKRQVVGSYQLPQDSPDHRFGTYWGIRSQAHDYPVRGLLPLPSDQTARLAAVPTRLAAMTEVLQERLINWGYGICDTAMRSWVDRGLPQSSGFPYPGAGVGSAA